MGSLKLSVFLITLNEEERLQRTLKAAQQVADEIVLVDSGSTDNTLEIATSAGVKIHHNTFDGYGSQKRFAEDQCSHGWLLNLDADEVLTDELIAEINAFKNIQKSKFDGYRLRILNVYPGAHKPRPFANDYNEVRLYCKAVMRYRDHPTFDRVVIPGSSLIGQMQAPIYHFPTLSLQQMIAKLDAYSSRQAQISKRSKWKLIPRIPFEYPLQFFKYMILRRHIFGGLAGLQFSHELSKSKVRRLLKFSGQMVS